MLEVIAPPDSAGPEVDRFGDFPHPREMLSLIGHRKAETEFLESLRAGRLHHAWLIAGDEGIGKATFAYRIARFMLAYGMDPQKIAQAQSLYVPASEPAAHQIASGGHPDLAVMRRNLSTGGKTFYTEIRVEDVRKALELFNKTAAFGGYRIAIVDCCDEMNRSSANAVLNTLEEPPERGLFLLVANRPGGLLPTIRSRCRLLTLSNLDTAEVLEGLRNMPGADGADDALRSAAVLESDGSLRRALTMLDKKKLLFINSVRDVLDDLPKVDAAKVDTIAGQVVGRNGDEAFVHFCDISARWMTDRLHLGGHVRLDQLALAWADMNERRQQVDIYNLDRRPFVLQTIADFARIVA